MAFRSIIQLALRPYQGRFVAAGVRLMSASSTDKVLLKLDDKSGIDIMEMYNPKEERLRVFWRSLQDFWIRLYGTRLPVIAAINGHTPAGGCLLAMSCDYRLIADGKFTIGLTETLLGIVAPPWFQDVMINTLGHRQTERALQLGYKFNTREALNVGLVDQVVSAEELMTIAETELKKWMEVPEAARQYTKDQLRRPTIDKLESYREEDINHFVDFTTRSSIQKSLGNYLQQLKSKSKSKE